MVKEKIKQINSTSNVVVISNGIEEVVEKNSPKENYILFLGRIEVDQKGLDLLIPAFKKFSETNKKLYKLIIAGDGVSVELEKLQKLIQKSGVSNSIELAGKVSGEKKEKLLRKAACVVVPSRFETYSLVALEALAHGAPLICFNIKGLSWIPEKVARKVAAYNVNGLANAMTAIVSDSKVSEAMSKSGKSYAQDFTWDAIADQYDKYISKVVHN
jgi:glycosyltransferase involved in cell wall biosynthesis